jgi:hypothetical protein
MPAGSLTNLGVSISGVACVSVGACVAVGSYIDANWGSEGLFEEFSPLALGPTSITWSSFTLNGYDKALVQDIALDVEDLGTAGWDLTVVASGLPTAGAAHVASPSVNGSLASAGSSSPPGQTCVGSCTAASGSTVTYSVTVPVGTAVDLYNAAAGSGIGEVVLGTRWWIAVPADAVIGSCVTTITLTTAYRP